MNLPTGDDDHKDFDDLEYLGHEGQHQPAHHQCGTRQAAAAGMTPTQASKDQEEAGLILGLSLGYFFRQKVSSQAPLYAYLGPQRILGDPKKKVH